MNLSSMLHWIATLTTTNQRGPSFVIANSQKIAMIVRQEAKALLSFKRLH